MLESVLNLMNADESDNFPDKSSTKSSEYQKSESIHVTSEMEAAFVSSLYNGIGLALESRSRLVFDEFVKKITGFIKIDDTPLKRATLSESNLSYFRAENPIHRFHRNKF